jgi:hypothetical protein
MNIGPVLVGRSRDTTYSISNTGNDTLKIASITSTNIVFSVRLTMKNIPPGQSAADTIRYAPNVIGTAIGKLLITSNAPTSPDTVNVSGRGVGVPVLTLAQSSLNIGSVKLGQYKDTTVTIKNTGNDTLKITAITSTDGVFSARPTVKNISPGQSVADTIRYTPNVIGTASGRILVASNATTSPDTVSVTGMGVGVPVLMLAQSSLNIGSVRLGQYKDTTVTISNTGNDTLKITAITSTNSAFSARPTVKNVPPGGIFVDTIRYAPIVIGTANGNLLITSNDATTPDTMAVTGIGTPVSAIDDALSQIPEEYSLDQNYPNPFNPSTTIRFGLPVRSSVQLTIYNTLGQLVASLVNSQHNAGWHQVRWEATISSGLYIYRLEAVSVDEPDRRFVEAKKMIVIR